MTNQEKKEFLNRYRGNERELLRTQEEILRWESLSRKTTSAPGSMGGGDGSDRLQTAVEHIVPLQNRLTAQVIARVQLREQIEDAIATVPDERLQLLLRYRYIDGWTWERIAVEISYTYRNVTRLHGQALDQLKMS